MNRIKNKLIILVNIVIILFCITISFAWMDNMEGLTTNRFVEMIFGKDIYGEQKSTNIFIAPNTLDVQLYIDNNGSYELIGDSNNNEGVLYEKQNAAPDDFIKYNMVITNKTLIDANISVMLSNISSNYEKIYDYVYIGLLSTKGFNYPYEPPYININDTNAEICLGNDLIDSGTTQGENPGEIVNSKSHSLFSNILLPKGIMDGDSNIIYQPVEIRFYIRISHTAKNDIQNKYLKIENLSFMVV